MGFAESCTCTGSTISSTERNSTRASDTSRAFIGQEKHLEWIVELLLDDYVRSYAPAQPQRRNNTAQSQNVNCESRNSGRVEKSSSRSTKPKKGPKRRRAMGGPGESEDEDSNKQGQDTLGTTNLHDSCLWACPFLKRRPQIWGRTCKKKLKQISYVKDHIEKVHYLRYCPRCFSTFAKDGSTSHLCRYKSTAPVELITTEKLMQDKERADSTKTHEEQWQHIYMVLFPNEPVCPDPYLDNITTEGMSRVEKYFRSPRAQKLLKDELKDCPEFQGEMKQRVGKFVCLGTFPPKRTGTGNFYSSTALH
ncbi:hypothetical protein FZEAL_2212 [Fusarium zealandicum]|uniref:C2H2-type domain-containing protein n=1 Tax=Fusarium zealandicum TaxID=1053134 RepID=A0A8H4UR47_9HYPO|nr:hypothetical protein FZEAL_2212 [Fusarium zealandicum]